MMNFNRTLDIYIILKNYNYSTKNIIKLILEESESIYYHVIPFQYHLLIL